VSASESGAGHGTGPMMFVRLFVYVFLAATLGAAIGLALTTQPLEEGMPPLGNWVESFAPGVYDSAAMLGGLVPMAVLGAFFTAGAAFTMWRLFFGRLTWKAVGLCAVLTLLVMIPVAMLGMMMDPYNATQTVVSAYVTFGGWLVFALAGVVLAVLGMRERGWRPGAVELYVFAAAVFGPVIALRASFTLGWVSLIQYVDTGGSLIGLSVAIAAVIAAVALRERPAVVAEETAELPAPTLGAPLPH